MKRKFLCWTAVSIIIMLVLPYLAANFVKGDAAMAVCFLLFFVVNPIHSIVMGLLAGRAMKQLWNLPIISAIIFLLGTWMFFDPGESAFMMYAGIYLTIGIVVMFLSAFLYRKLQR